MTSVVFIGLFSAHFGTFGTLHRQTNSAARCFFDFVFLFLFVLLFSIDKFGSSFIKFFDLATPNICYCSLFSFILLILAISYELKLAFLDDEDIELGLEELVNDEDKWETTVAELCSSRLFFNA